MALSAYIPDCNLIVSLFGLHFLREQVKISNPVAGYRCAEYTLLRSMTPDYLQTYELERSVVAR